jgi:hypothetical protein
LIKSSGVIGTVGANELDGNREGGKVDAGMLEDGAGAKVDAEVDGKVVGCSTDGTFVGVDCDTVGNESTCRFLL